MGSGKNHVFLFRHCVRSTEESIKFHDGQDEEEKDASYFTASPLPDMDTPTYWCTNNGMNVMKATGNYVWNNILNSHANKVSKHQIQFVTDVSQRDVDTSFALYTGIQDANNDDNAEERASLTGLLDLQYDPQLFNPISTLCAANYSNDRFFQDVKKRLQTVPPPGPLNETLVLLEQLGGIGAAGSLLSMNPQVNSFDLNQYTDSKNKTKVKFKGAVNIVKLYAQMMFYSRASNIDPPFLPNATSEELYKLIQWIYWSRTILSVDNVIAATKGMVLSNAIMETLQNGHYKVKGSNVSLQRNAPKLNMSSATFFVGHDGSLDDVATALGVRWELRSPYLSDGALEYIPTPPGAALHFQYDLDTEALHMSFLYPIFPLQNDEKDDYIHTYGTSFKFERTPLIFLNNNVTAMSAYEVSIANQTTSIRSQFTRIKKTLPLDELRKRLEASLNQYPEATACFENTINSPRIPTKIQDEIFGMFLGGVILLSAIFYITYKYGKERRTSNASYFSSTNAQISKIETDRD